MYHSKALHIRGLGSPQWRAAAFLLTDSVKTGCESLHIEQRNSKLDQKLIFQQCESEEEHK